MSNPRDQKPNEVLWRRKRAIWVGWKYAKTAQQGILRSTGETLSDEALEILAGCFKAALLREIQQRPNMSPTAAATRRKRAKAVSGRVAAPQDTASQGAAAPTPIPDAGGN